MEAIVLKLLDISAISCFIIIAVLILRLVFKKAPAYIRCLLWVMVGLRLALPISIESDFSLIPTDTPVSSYVEIEQDVQNKPDSENKIPTVVLPPVTEDAPIMQAPPATDNAPTPQAPPAVEDAPTTQAPPVTQVPTEPTPKKTDVKWENIAFYIWMTGTLLMLGYLVLSYLWMRKGVRGAFLYDNNTRIFNGTATPFVLGIIKPTIYIPSNFKDEQLACILAHEKAHIARGDHIYKPLAFLLLAFYWFNPLVWVSYILFRKDIELACDEKVIADMTTEQRKLYSVTLLACGTKRFKLSAPLAFGEVGIKERVKNIMSYKKPSFWIIIIAVIVAVLTAVLFITSPSTTEKGSSSEESSEDASAENSEDDEDFAKDEMTLELVDDDTNTDDGLRFVDNTIEGKLIKLSFDTDITDFKFLAVSWQIDGDTIAYIKTEDVFETLYAVDKLKAGTPFYVNIEDDHELYASSATRAIEFTNANGATEQYYIRRSPHPNTLNPITTEEELKNYPGFYLSSASTLDENPITVQYELSTANTNGQRVYTDTGKADELVGMYIGNTVTDFKILAVSWNENATPSFKTLYKLDKVIGKVYFKTSLSKEEALTSVTRAIEFINPAGNKMRYYLRTHEYGTSVRSPYIVYLQSVTGAPKPNNTHATVERLNFVGGGGIDDGVLYNDFDEFSDQIRISVNAAVTDFKFLSVSWNENSAPVFDTLFYAGTITPEKPFYAQTFIARDSALTSVDRAIEYTVAGGKTERFYIKAEVGSGTPFITPWNSYHWTLTLKPISFEPERVNPNEVAMYVPTEDGYSFKTVTTECGGTPAGIIKALTKGTHSKKGAILPEGIEVNFFRIINNVIHIDLNKAFEDFIKTDTLSEHQGIGCVVNTLLGYYKADRVFITVDGMRLKRADGRMFSRPIGFYTAEGDSTADDATKYATLYLANINNMQLYPYPYAVDGTPEGLIDALIEVKELREGVAINSFKIEDGCIYLDLNQVFYEQVDAGLMAEIAMDVVISTFGAYYDAEQPIKHVFLTIDGEFYSSDYA